MYVLRKYEWMCWFKLLINHHNHGICRYYLSSSRMQLLKSYIRFPIVNASVLMRLILNVIVLTFLSASMLSAQSSKLANQYYLDGEYEKAADMYKMLFQKSTQSDHYFNRYIECLLALEDYSGAESTIRQKIKSHPNNPNFHVSLGNVLERQNKFEDADAEFLLAIESLPPEVSKITKLGNSFIVVAKYDLAIRTYEKGATLLKNPGIFSYNLADLYRRKGDTNKMIEYYMISLINNPNRMGSIQSILQRSLAKDDFDILLEKIYGLLQENPDTDYFPEMLAWVFIQKKDYKSALRQIKALDKRLDENGNRVISLAQVAANARDYKTAIDAYEYIVDAKGPSSRYYLEAKRSALSNKKKLLLREYEPTNESFQSLQAEYITFLDKAGWNKNTASIVNDLAKLEAFHLNDLDTAIIILNDLIGYPGVNQHIKANAKLSLADYYLMKGEIWESTLLYSQVDKQFQEEILGQEARFRNAKLSYYNGDFEWAQTQFDVLKASTSKLIANDALDLSIFIMDNLGLDTTDHPMTVFADADLLIFQNRFDEAIEQLNILSNIYPDHGLQDDIKYSKAQIAMKRRDYSGAAVIFQDIIDNHTEEIRADNSMFALAELYENQLDDVQKAQELYERIFIEFSGSTFSIEARKRYRILRGDFEEVVN